MTAYCSSSDAADHRALADCLVASLSSCTHAASTQSDMTAALTGLLPSVRRQTMGIPIAMQSSNSAKSILLCVTVDACTVDPDTHHAFTETAKIQRAAIAAGDDVLAAAVNPRRRSACCSRCFTFAAAAVKPKYTHSCICHPKTVGSIDADVLTPSSCCSQCQKSSALFGRQSVSAAAKGGCSPKRAQGFSTGCSSKHMSTSSTAALCAFAVSVLTD